MKWHEEEIWFGKSEQKENNENYLEQKKLSKMSGGKDILGISC
jgi:hypothetical protein